LATLAVGVLYLVACDHADARPPFWRRPPAPPYSVALEDEDGDVLPTFHHAGKTYLLGEPGLRYNVRVRNPTAQRVEAVITVDGRDAISGRVGDYVNGRGYVIAPYGSVLVEGFRQSLDAVAAFRFTSPENSYSARRGTPENVGVIGVAFFPERERPRPPERRVAVPPPRAPHRPYYEYGSGGRSESGPSAGAPEPKKSRDAAAESSRGAPSRLAPAEPRYAPPSDRDRGDDSVNNLGTEYGERHDSSVVEVPFERASRSIPTLVTSLYYDDADGLEARGIDLSSLGYPYARNEPPRPEPFPRSRFAEPPP
jgi:hypothetical protein